MPSANNQDEPPETDREAPAAASTLNTLGLALTATVGSVIFGHYAQDLASWIVCFHADEAKGAPCGDAAQVEAIMIGTLVSTMVAILAAAVAVRLGKMSDRAAFLAIVGALAGALFALLKAAAKGATYPRPELLGRPLYIYFVCIALFVIPYALMPRRGNGQSAVVDIYRRIAIAILIGAVFGYAAQLIAELYWKGLGGGWGASKFVIAPSATVMATGGWGIALFDPVLRSRVWANVECRKHVSWMMIFGVGAVVLAAGYGAFFYYFDGAEQKTWLEKAHFDQVATAVMVAALLLPGLAGLAGTTAFMPRLGRAAAAAAIAGAALAACAAWYTAAVRLAAQPAYYAAADTSPFVIAHMLAAVGAVATIYVAHRIAERLFPVQ